MTQYIDDFYITDNKKLLLDRYDEIHKLLKKSYSASDRTIETMYKAISNSLNFAVLETASNKIVGYARVITDYATIFYLSDVCIDENYRGKGLGKTLMEWICLYEDKFLHLNGLLETNDTQKFYKKFGFKECKTTHMILER